MRSLALGGGGGNVTVPHKESAATTVDRPSARTAGLGACNTFWGEGGFMAGENTDVEGILDALDHLEAPRTAWLIAGTGGAARAAVAAAMARGAAVGIRSRDSARRSAFEGWVQAQGGRVTSPDACDVLINATPLGLHGGDHLPLALEEAPHAQVALDMVYARGETPWIRQMRLEGLRAEDGRLMLVAQGAAAFRCWFADEDPPVEVMRAAVNRVLNEPR
jgi:shikimate dehydrogenase